MAKKIIEASELPNGEKVYLKKDVFGWRIVEPIRNEDGTVNWFNFFTGGKRNLLTLIAVLAIIGLFFLGFSEQINSIQSYYSMIINELNQSCGFPIGDSVPINLSQGLVSGAG